MDEDEDDRQNAEDREAQDDSPIGPGILRAAPLKSEQADDDGDDKDAGANQIELLGAFAESNFLFGAANWGVEEEEYDDQGDSSQRYYSMLA